jgi:nucleotide-binding universal stress UspA family protein
MLEEVVMYKKILLPLDGSTLAEQAIEPAMVLAEQTGGKVILIQAPVMDLIVSHPVIGGYGVLLPDQSSDEAFAQANSYLGQIQNKYRHSGVTIVPMVVDGDPASAIVDTAVSEKVDLIVMSTHGRSGLDRFIMGSVTEKVLQKAPCPVLALRSGDPIRNVLMTLDGSAMSETAVKPGLDLARGLGAHPIILRVDNRDSYLDQRELDEINHLEPGLAEQVMDSFYNRIPDYVKRIVGQYQQDEDQEIETAIAEGDPADYILRVAADKKVDVIVMATHGRSGLRRWLYGSTTNKVMRATGRSMLIVRPPAAAYEAS